MRMCIVSRELAPFTGWGVGTYAANAARALADAGHETHVLTAPPRSGFGKDIAASLFPSVRLHSIDRSGPPASLRHVPCRATQGPLAIFQTLRALHQRHAFDYIEFADFYGEACFAAQARRTTALFDHTTLAVRLHSPIFVLRAVNEQTDLALDTACVEHMEAEAIRGVDLVLSPSRAMVEQAGALMDAEAPRMDAEAESSKPRVPPPQPWLSRAHVLPYPFNPALLSSTPDRPALPSRAPPEVLFFGRLEYRKGVHLLIEAGQRLLAEGLDLRVRIVGQDTTTAPGNRPMRDWLRSRIDPRWAARFAFEPNRSRDELAGLIRGATICCLPSIWENFPFAALESMAAGRCVIGADAGGIPEIVRDGIDGLLFRAADAASLAEALRRALADNDLRNRIESAAPARVAELCDPRRVVHQLEAILLQSDPTSRSSRPSRSESSPPSSVFTSDARPTANTVSVLIPFFNLAHFLPEAIASVRRQTRPPDEILIIDDGSTDPDARALIDRIEREGQGRGGPPLRILRQPNRGLSAARNAGLIAARSRWVIPLDADDMLAPTFIETALAAAARQPEAVLITSWMSCLERSPDKPTLLFVPIGFDRDMLTVANVASSCTALLDRETVIAAGGYDESLHAYEDWDLYCTLAERFSPHAAAIIPEPLILNRIRPDSMLRAMSNATRQEYHARVRAKHPNLVVHPDRVRRMLNGRVPSPRGLRPLIARIARRLRGVLDD